MTRSRVDRGEGDHGVLGNLAAWINRPAEHTRFWQPRQFPALGTRDDLLARVDLAASMLAVLDDNRYRRATVSVVTTVDNPSPLQWIRHEALAKR